MNKHIAFSITIVIIALGALFYSACGDEELAKLPEKWKLVESQSTVDGTPPSMTKPNWIDKNKKFMDNSALQRDVFEQNAVADVDILWIIDNSGSMQEEQEKLGANFNNFISYLLQTKVHYHIGAVTTDTISDTDSGKLHSAGSVKFLTDELCNQTNIDCSELFAEMVQVGTEGSPQEKGLEAAMMALIPPNVSLNYDQCGSAPNGCFYRPAANLAVIIITDEEDKSVGDANYYVRFFEGLKGYGNSDMITVSAIAGSTPKGCITQYQGSNAVLGTSCSAYTGCASGGVCLQYDDAGNGYCTISCTSDATCGDQNGNYKCKDNIDYNNPSAKYCVPNSVAASAERYIYVAQQTGGIFTSICLPDFNVALNELGFTVSGLRKEFGLSRLPDASTISVTMRKSGETTDTVVPANDATNGWTYNSTNNSIVFGKNILPPQFSVVTATYRVASSGGS